jgi:thymidine phosphorylase
MSKKLAEGLDGLVLDVKTGDGAFLTELDDSRRLAETMCDIGRAMGKRVVALITRMDQPLGRAVGNAVEVAEGIACLRGEGPVDLMEVSLLLAAEMVLLAGLADSIDEARTKCERTVADGSALDRFRRLIAAQGGDAKVVDDPGLLPKARRSVELKARRAGFVHALSARPIGFATMLLGAGRARVDSTINPAVGLIVHKRTGDRVEIGESLCTLLVDEEAALPKATAMIEDAYRIADEPIDAPPLVVVERIEADFS